MEGFALILFGEEPLVVGLLIHGRIHRFANKYIHKTDLQGFHDPTFYIADASPGNPGAGLLPSNATISILSNLFISFPETEPVFKTTSFCDAWGTQTINSPLLLMYDFMISLLGDVDYILLFKGYLWVIQV